MDISTDRAFDLSLLNKTRNDVKPAKPGGVLSSTLMNKVREEYANSQQALLFIHTSNILNQHSVFNRCLAC